MSYITDLQEHQKTFVDLQTHQKHTWCSGCGNYGILNAVMRAIALEWYASHEVIIANDVWCSGNMSDKIVTNTIHGLHGRVTALASGIHCAVPHVPIFAFAWDGATLSEGINHLIHTARNNYNFTFLLHNNQNYWLTTWQASSTTPRWTKMKWTVGQVTSQHIIPAHIVLSAGGTFVARWYSGDVEQLTGLIRQWMNHRWFSFIEVLQLCPTYNKATPTDRYEKRVYDVIERSEYDIWNKYAAMKIVEETDHIATGVLYRNIEEKDFMSLQENRKGRTTSPVHEVIQVDIWSLMSPFFV